MLVSSRRYERRGYSDGADRAFYRCYWRHHLPYLPSNFLKSFPASRNQCQGPQWSQKTIMIIDGVSVRDKSALGIINMNCKSARSLDRGSSHPFGGLPVVILLGDFHQFPPVVHG